MSKKKGAKSKKIDPKNVVPMKTVFDVLLDQYEDPTSLTLAQQKYVINVLGLNDNSLYDSVSINIITDCIRFCMKLKLQTKHIESIYHILRNALYKMKNSVDFGEKNFKEYVHTQLSLKLPIKASQDLSEQTPDSNPDKSNEKNNDITNEILESIKLFVEDRILSEYTVYRAALFKNNPSNIQYEKFKNNFKVGNIVKFQHDQYLSQIKQINDNHVVLKLLDQENEVEFIMSKDQTKFLQFVSEELSKSDMINQNDENDENEEPKQEEMTENEIENENENVNQDEVDQDTQNPNQDAKDNMTPNDTNDGNEKTMIDIIVNERVEQALKAMQEKIDQYKQEISELG